MKPFTINFELKKPLYLQIVDGIIADIQKGMYKKGDRIYSINEVSNEYFIAKDTVQKAYNLLRSKGVITSVHGKGFFIDQVDLQFKYRILLLFTKISNYKRQIHDRFVQMMGEGAVVDLKIHNFNTRLFQQQVENNLHGYDYFVVMPHFYDEPELALQTLKLIPEGQLIIIDKNIPDYNMRCAAVYQDFENDILIAMEQGLDLLEKYNKLILVYPKIIAHAPDIIKGFRKFCMQNSYPLEVISEIDADTALQSKAAYVVIEEIDLANLIKISMAKKLEIGRDIGIISYNDSPLKELLLGGITVISTNHIQMGETAARLILENKKDKIKNPFVFIRRNSL